MSKKLFIPAVLLILLVGFFVVPLGKAHAAALTSACLSAPSSANCDGQDPAQTGCNVGAVHLGIIRNTWENQQDYQDNQVWWSNACRSNFGFVNSFTGQNLLIVALFRSDQSGVNCNANNGTACTVNGQPCFGISGCDAVTGGNALVYCATPTPRCRSMVSNTKTWETDLLYAPNQQIQVCQIAGGMGEFYCSAWH